MTVTDTTGQNGQVQSAMASGIKKPTTYRVYLSEQDALLMKSICEKTELGQSELLTKAVSAALRAIDANSGRFSLPLRFSVQDSAETERRGALEPKPRK